MISFEKKPRSPATVFSGHLFGTGTMNPTATTVPQCMSQYEAFAEQLTAMLVTTVHFGAEPQDYLLPRTITSLSSFPQISGYTAWTILFRYPVLVAIYAAGITALAVRRFDALAALLLKPTFRDDRNGGRRNVLHELVGTLHKADLRREWFPFADATRRFTPLSALLIEVARPKLRSLIPDDQDFEEHFDTFEYLVSLLYWQEQDRLSGGSQKITPLGAFHWRDWKGIGARTRQNPPFDAFVKAETAEGFDSAFLRARFFGGSKNEFLAIVAAHDAWGKAVPLSTG